MSSRVDMSAIFSSAVKKSGIMDGGTASHVHEEYRGQELDFARDILGCKTWRGDLSFNAAQRGLMKAVFGHKRVAVYSGRGHGKDFTAARIALTWFYTRPSRVLCFAPSLRQLKTILFRELSESFNRASVKLHGEMLTMSLKVDASHFIMGIASANPDNVRGFHAGVMVPGDPDADEFTEIDLEEIQKISDGDESSSVLIILDEPEGIPEEVFRTLEGTLSKKNVHVLMIGNPIQSITDEHTYPKSLLNEDGDWYKIKLSTFPESQFPDPDSWRYDEVYDDPPGWLIPREAREKALRDYTPDDPIFLSDWLGRFSTSEVESQVIPSRLMPLSEGRYVDNRARHALGPRIGVDLGFGGADPCVAILLMDGVAMAVDEWRPPADDPTTQITVAEYVRNLAVEWGAQVGELFPEKWGGDPISGGRLSVDDSGLSGVCDIMAGMKLECDRVNFGKKPDGHHKDLIGTTRLRNCRAEMYWTARMGLSDGMFYIPNEERFRTLREELPWTLYERSHDGEFPVIFLEDKKSIKKRHGRSPDHADAFVLACRETDAGIGVVEAGPPVLGRVISVDEAKSPGYIPKSRRGLGWKRIF